MLALDPKPDTMKQARRKRRKSFDLGYLLEDFQSNLLPALVNQSKVLSQNTLEAFKLCKDRNRKRRKQVEAAKTIRQQLNSLGYCSNDSFFRSIDARGCFKTVSFILILVDMFVHNVFT